MRVDTKLLSRYVVFSPPVRSISYKYGTVHLDTKEHALRGREKVKLGRLTWLIVISY